MKFISLMTILLISQLAMAQRSTGSGGLLDQPPILHLHDQPVVLRETDPIKPIEIDLRAGNPRAYNRLSDLARIVNARNELCGAKGEKLIDMKKMKFLEIHLALKVLQSTYIADKKCDVSYKYFQCILPPDIRFLITETLKEKDVSKYLENEKLTKKEIKEMIKFFKTIDKKCDPDACQM